MGPSEGNLDARAVLGVKTDYQNNAIVDYEYYLEVNVSADGNVGAALKTLGAESSPIDLKAGAFLTGDLVVGETVDTSNTPVSGNITLSAGAGGQAGLELEKFSHLNNAGGAGAEADLSYSLDLSDSGNLDLWNKVTSDASSNTDGGLIGQGNAYRDRRCAREGDGDHDRALQDHAACLGVSANQFRRRGRHWGRPWRRRNGERRHPCGIQTGRVDELPAVE